jgi:hypothetical protein
VLVIDLPVCPRILILVISESATTALKKSASAEDMSSPFYSSNEKRKVMRAIDRLQKSAPSNLGASQPHRGKALYSTGSYILSGIFPGGSNRVVCPKPSGKLPIKSETPL